MSSTCTIDSPPWTGMSPHQVIDESILIPPGDITISLIIGDSDNPCTRSETSDSSEPRRLLDVVRTMKGRCRGRNCNNYCTRPTRGVGEVTFVSWDLHNATLVLKLCYDKPAPRQE